MLVVAWEAMYESIPRLQAEEQLAAYTVAVLATPAPDADALSAKQRVINEWKQLVIGRTKKVIEVTVAKLRDLLTEAFGEQIRD